mgnify:CR=1 FL=1
MKLPSLKESRLDLQQQQFKKIFLIEKVTYHLDILIYLILVDGDLLQQGKLSGQNLRGNGESLR